MDRDMLVCGCCQVSYGKLVDAVENGARSYEEVKAATAVAAGCGRCEANVKLLVEELLKNKA